MEPQSNFGAVANQDRGKVLLDKLVSRKDRFLSVLPAFIAENRERYFEACLVALRNPDIAACSPETVLTSILRSAQWGLLTDGVQGALVPYKGACTFQPMYQGLIQVARRSGDIRQVWAANVYEGDHLHLDMGDAPKLVHRPKIDTDKTDYSLVRAAYACARWVDGRVTFEFVGRTELDKIRNVSKARSDASPWQVWPERQSLKTALKRLTKVLPMANEEGTLLAASEHEAGYEVVDAEVGGRKVQGNEAVALLNTGDKARSFLGDDFDESMARSAPAQEPVSVTQAVRETQAKRALTPEEQRLQDKDKQ